MDEYGLNKLPESKTDGFFVIFLRQFQSPLIYILLIASFIVFFLFDVFDAIIIFSVLFINAVIGTIKEGRAQNTILALNKFTKTKAVVLRDNQEVIIPDHEVVPGDILILREGDKVSSDGRIIYQNNLHVDESALTGESSPVAKTSEVLISENLQTADQTNMVFKGTLVSSGTARSIVTSTGVQTVLGKISKQLAGIDTEVPLKKNINYLSKIIAVAILFISSFVFIAGIFFGYSVEHMFLTSVAIMVSLIPEGLPIVITLILATGVHRMAKQNALVKRLQAVDTLGQASVIAVDKTGTVTKNELTVLKIFIDGKEFKVSGSGYEPKGDILLHENIVDPLDHPELLLAGKISVFNSSAKAVFLEKKKIWKISGDPTEAAIRTFAEKVSFEKIDLEGENKKIFELPFNSKNKYCITIHKGKNKNFLSMTGAPEVVLKFCKNIYSEGKEKRLTKEILDSIYLMVNENSAKGLRVVAFAYRNTDRKSVSEGEDLPLVFGGLYFMNDVLRPAVKFAVEEARSNGIRVVMITGDHRVTAGFIAKEAGIWQENDEILTGEEIEKLSETELFHKLKKVSVFARVTPEHKLKIIELYKKRGDIVAMTGDGVNDALSLVAADLGVSMGKIGTEVTKEASDIILLDDNFKSIVLAIEEGRNIYKTIKKVILYLFSTSMGELFTIVSGLFILSTLPILPSQIIWLNLVTDGFLVVSLSMEPREKLSGKSLRRSDRLLFDKLMFWRMILMGGVMSIGAFFVFNHYYANYDEVKAWTVCLVVLAVFQWFNVWNCKSDNKSIFTKEFFSNKYLILSTIVVFLLQLMAVYAPFMQTILKTTSINVFDWFVVFLVALSIMAVEEVRKLLTRRVL